MKRYIPFIVLSLVVACGSSGKRVFPLPDATNDLQTDTIVDVPDVKQDKTTPKEDVTTHEDLDTQEKTDGDATVGPVACKTNADCIDAPITLEKCQVKECNKKTELCEAAWNKNCCLDKTFFDEGFENGIPDGWVVTDNNKNDKVTWSVVDYKSVDGNKSLYLGDPTCHTYYTGPMTDCKPDDGVGSAGGIVKVSINTPPIYIPPTKGTFILSFYILSDTEALIPELTDNRQPDQFRIDVLYGNNFSQNDVLFSNIKIQKTTKGRFKFIIANLQTYVGETIRLRLIFDTLSKTENFYGGIYIDDLKMFSTCTLDGCHTTDADSPDQDQCTDDSCILFTNSAGAGYYAHPKDTYCGKECMPDNIKFDCPNTDTCKKVSCVNNICKYEDIVPCCNPQNLFKDGFETGGLNKYSITNGPQNKGVRWQISQKRADKGKNALYYGDTLKGNYDSTGSKNFGYISTPYMDLSKNGYANLTFDLFMSTEWDDKPTYLNPAKNDIFYVEAIEKLGEGLDSPTKATTIWESGQINGTTHGKFIPVGIDLSPFVNKKISIRFNFFTGDAKDNTHEGIYLDNLSVDSTNCQENNLECAGAWDCMVDGTCRTGDCTNGKCVVTKEEDCCSFDLDCVDDTDCTNDWCDNNVCKHEFHEGPQCCQPKDIVSFDFDSNSGTLSDGFTVKNNCTPISSEDPKCPGWQVSDKKSNSGLYSIYFGNGIDYTKSGAANESSKGSFMTPAFALPLWGDVEVSFKCLVLIDPLDKDQQYSDMLNLEVIAINPDGSDGQATVIAGRGNGIPMISENPDKFDAVNSININSAVPSLRGHKARLRFSFDSKDQTNNNGLGIFIDDIQVKKVCPK